MVAKETEKKFPLFTGTLGVFVASQFATDLLTSFIPQTKAYSFQVYYAQVAYGLAVLVKSRLPDQITVNRDRPVGLVEGNFRQEWGNGSGLFTWEFDNV